MPRFCAHLGYLFTELPLEDRFTAARDAGFSAVEHPNPYPFGTTRFRDLLLSTGLGCQQIAAPAGDAEKGEKGFACLTARQADFRSSLNAGLVAARIIGAPMLHIMPGILLEGESRAGCRDTYVANLMWAANQCAEAGITGLIEPISDETVPGFYVNHPDFAAELIADIGSTSIRMLFDLYHAAVKDVDVLKFVSDHIDTIAHIQIADHPGRGEPGSGALDFTAFFALLDSLDYAGYVGCEYKPSGDTAATLGWMESSPHD